MTASIAKTHDDIAPARDSRLWTAVDDVLLRARTHDDLGHHGLHLLAARRASVLGLEVPPEWEVELRRSELVGLAVRALLVRVRDVVDGPVVLLKGPEVAARWEHPATRSFGDLDLLVPHAQRAHRALRSAGFVPVGDPILYVGIHHLRPLAHPALPLPVELHARVKWPDGMTPPATEELLELAVASTTGIAGIDAPTAAVHSVLLAGHSWAHVPLRRLSDLVDILAMLQETSTDEATAAAARWQAERLWQSTLSAARHAIHRRGRSAAVGTWARGLSQARERTVLESHVERYAAPFAIHCLDEAVVASLTQARRSLTPAPTETWTAKLRRSRLAIRHAFVGQGEHIRRRDRGGGSP